MRHRSSMLGGASKGFLLVMLFVIGIYLLNGQKPIMATATDTTLYIIGACTLWGAMVSRESFGNPAFGFIGGFIVYFTLLFVVLGVP